MTDWHFHPGQNFECSQCSRCCRGWRIAVDPQTAQNLQATPFHKRLEEKNGRFFARKDSQEACSFLTSERRCQLHSELGAAAKPRGCRQFPFRLTNTPDGVFVGTSFSCPSIQNNQGDSLEAYRSELEELAQGLPLWGAAGLTVWQDKRLAWSDYRRLEDFILQSTGVEAGLGQGLWALAQWSLKPQRPVQTYLENSAAALEPPAEPLMLMEHHWFSQLLKHCGEKPVGRHREAPSEPLERYLRALVHGKSLINRRPLLGNLALLYLLPRFYRYWYARSGSPDQTLDQCERKIATHPNNLDDLVIRMADDFRDQLEPIF
ncbi:MAG: YkgJ family cysteine cluster protein [Candidatus Eremiobacteraeota bacterium]|nr:YkgJ family cysteine cluster protein [Candidatus Eremiobacteraeota bacterium]